MKIYLLKIMQKYKNYFNWKIKCNYDYILFLN
jgi:hypothetical protein